MKKFIVEGMSCAACQARVEKAVSELKGVDSCSVSLLTNSMGVEGSASSDEIINAVVNAGYNARVIEEEKSLSQDESDISTSAYEEEMLKDTETPKLKKRLVSSIAFLIVLMYITMGHNMLKLPIPSFFHDNYLALSVTEMLLAIIVMAINNKFFVSGFRSLFHMSPNMDSLVALGSSESFLWSLYVVYKMCYMITTGSSNMDLMDIYHSELYFESAAMIPALITVGKMLEAMSKGRTTAQLKSLMKLSPKKAIVMHGDSEVEVDIAKVKVDDIFVVRPGDSIPVDGVVVDGESAIDESALTGESIPVDKSVGDVVSAATINKSGVIKCKATRIGKDTTINQIIKMVSDASMTKAPIARIADKVSGIFVPSVILIAIIVVGIWIYLGETLSFALARGISVLVISCPCALGLATPVAIMVGSGVGAKNGILFKTSESLEIAGKVNIIAFDKTGTITSGEPQVTDIYNINGKNDEELLQLAYALEKNSNHPLAKAIVKYIEDSGVNTTITELKNFKEMPGNGISAMLGYKLSHAGNKKYISKSVKIDDEVEKKLNDFASNGKTPILFESDDTLIGIIAVADVIKADSADAILALKAHNIKTLMLTGDNELTAKKIGKDAGVDEIIYEILPDEKGKIVEKLKNDGKVAMVGDGINDAVALTYADVGIAIGRGADIAKNFASIVLMNNSLIGVYNAITLSKATLKNIYENLFWAFFYNAICIPLAAGAFSYKMNPMLAALAMSLSSFTVCMNALRLNMIKLREPIKNNS